MSMLKGITLTLSYHFLTSNLILLFRKKFFFPFLYQIVLIFFEKAEFSTRTKMILPFLTCFFSEQRHAHFFKTIFLPRGKQQQLVKKTWPRNHRSKHSHRSVKYQPREHFLVRLFCESNYLSRNRVIFQ